MPAQPETLVSVDFGRCGKRFRLWQFVRIKKQLEVGIGGKSANFGQFSISSLLKDLGRDGTVVNSARLEHTSICIPLGSAGISVIGNASTNSPFRCFGSLDIVVRALQSLILI